MLFIDIYEFDQLDSGLIYLPFGYGYTIVTLLTGIFSYFSGN